METKAVGAAGYILAVPAVSWATDRKINAASMPCFLGRVMAGAASARFPGRTVYTATLEKKKNITVLH